MKVNPMGDRVLVQRMEAEKQTQSGIYLPDTAQEKPQKANVIEVGEGARNEKTGERYAPEVQKGQTVLLSEWGGTDVTVDGEEYVIVSSDDILAILD